MDVSPGLRYFVLDRSPGVWKVWGKQKALRHTEIFQVVTDDVPPFVEIGQTRRTAGVLPSAFAINHKHVRGPISPYRGLVGQPAKTVNAFPVRTVLENGQLRTAGFSGRKCLQLVPHQACIMTCK